MFKGKRIVLLIGVLLVILFVLAACQSEPVEVEVTREVEVPVEIEVPGETVEVEVEVTRVVEVPAEVEMAVAVIPFEEEWANSPHNDAEAEAFVHWDEDGEIQESCAKCHSTPGYMDFIGADGSEAGVVNAPAPLGSTVECAACHNDVTAEMTSVVMPSGVELMGLGDESRCIQCHQGRNSTVGVNTGFEEAGLAGEGVLRWLAVHHLV
jgi:cytochrome c553